MAERRITASILFADIQGYSKLLIDADKKELLRIVREDVETHILTRKNSILSNTWGDGYVICCHDPQDAAEIALKMLDAVRNRDWSRERFHQDFALRVGLHIQTVDLVTKPDGKEDIVGTGVDTAARIEPIADPNTIFCSEIFYLSLMQLKPRNIKGIPLGMKSLAKNYGEMNLYRLTWQHEAVAEPVRTAPAAIPIPHIKKPITDKQRVDFVRSSFEGIRTYFTQALKELEKQYPGVESSLSAPTNDKFICELYLNGQSKGRCKIWIADGPFARNSIGYAEGNFDTTGDSHYNDIIGIDDDGGTLYLKGMMGDVFAYSSGPVKGDAVQAATALWTRFIRVLNNR